ncbi:AraC family transcriptional regulator [Rhizobium sp. Root708]|uniref:helix-turn-helix domain-containing protein n=1 Tax=Rhizobium sp. Root708 TaxID=1736592 RepID=UPI0006FFFCDA|nr:helix-turn-helix domain-containing protein [Rhizobium sp. Root708]KRB55027.1 AraC family transcriptional regulator [Rhizobium sp. Root708]
MKDKNNGQLDEWLGSLSAFLIERHIADAMPAAHWHDHVEINLLLEGSMTYLFNGRQQQVEAGRLVLFWAAIPHQTIAVTADAPLVCIYLPLGEFLALPIDGGARQAIMQGAFIVDPQPSASTRSHGADWASEWETATNIRRDLIIDEVKVRVRRLILDYGEHRGASASNVATPVTPAIRYAQQLTDLINVRYSRTLTLPMLAGFAGVHATTANRAFRDVLGISVMEYLARYRLARAMQRLAETNETPLQIAHDCGFGSVSRFYDTFKGRTGMSPQQYRRSLRGTP